MKKEYDIFISYRREGGFETAQMISQHLKYKGYNVFSIWKIFVNPASLTNG